MITVRNTIRAFAVPIMVLATTVAAEAQESPPVTVTIASPSNGAPLLGGSHQDFSIATSDPVNPGRVQYIRLTLIILANSENPGVNIGTFMNETSTGAIFPVNIPRIGNDSTQTMTATAEALDVDMQPIGSQTKTYTVITYPD